ncbi:MAG: trigger factor [Planctomycetes bacterium]|nr:trigger factor [Planctomycetota bacterium]
MVQAQVKEVGPCKVQITIEVPKDKVKKELEDKYSHFMTNAVVSGFRKGHAPRHLIERKFGKDIHNEVKLDLINTSSTEAFKENNLDPITDPSVEFEKIIMDETKPMNFDITVEVMPKIELTDYTGVTVKKHKIEVTSKETDSSLDEIRQARGEWVIADNKTQKGDLLIVDQELKIDDKVISKQENSQLVLGPELMMFGKPAPVLVQTLQNAKKGETKEVTIPASGGISTDKVPDDAEKADYRPDVHRDSAYGLRNKDAHLKVTIKEIKRLKLPEVNEAWAKEMGFDSLAKLKDELKKRLHRQKENIAARQTEDEILDKILSKTDFPVPESLVNESTDHLVRRRLMQMQLAKMPEEKIKEMIDKLKTETKEIAVRDIKIEFICDHIAKKEKIFVTEDDIKQRINEMAAAYRKWPEEIKKNLESRNMMHQLRNEVKEEKVRQFLREKAKIADDK